ncbi:helix-turn-helix transcriptional regulator, partial [Patescibacteria group bacterium]|nr:helix-turn-helix transcriptional regulator [Patescibacteria group bacterium]
IEAGYTPSPSIDTVAKIAKALNAKIDELVR